jgi:hypothetical protein
MNKWFASFGLAILVLTSSMALKTAMGAQGFTPAPPPTGGGGGCLLPAPTAQIK